MRKYRLTITAGIAGGVLSLAALTAASAAPAAPARPAAITGHSYSQFLAGDVLTSNGLKIVAGEWRGVNLPDLSAAIPPVPPDTVASGLDLSQFVTGGEQTALAEVWDDTVHAGACGPGAWTLEYNPVLFNTGTITPMPVPVGALQPVNPGSTAYPFCQTGQAHVFLFIYHSDAHHVTLYLAGPSSSDYDTLAVANQFVFFHTDASGVSTTNGAVAANLPAGNILGDSGVGTFFAGANTVFGQGFNLAHLNYRVFEGTVTGGPPSVSNPKTLTFNGPHGAAASYGIDAP